MQIRDCFEMLRKLRFTKINDGLRELDGPLTAQLNNFSATECNNIRPFFQGSLDQFFKLSKVGWLKTWRSQTIHLPH